MNQSDPLGLFGFEIDVKGKDGGELAEYSDPEKCTIKIWVGHFSRSINLIPNQFPDCSAMSFIGCGMNFLNGQIPGEHALSAPSAHEDLPLNPKNQEFVNNHWRIPNDAKNSIGYIDSDQLNELINISAKSAKEKAASFCKPKGCCDSIKIKIECDAGLSKYSGSCGKTATYNCGTKAISEYK